MLTELRIQNLGVIEQVSLFLGPGLTALTGETGAGKTMLVDAIELLVGGRADASIVRPGADEAVVEGRFAVGDTDVVLARVVPRIGRSRAYVDGRLAPASALAEWGRRLVDLHGQHAHQSLLATATQRAALDRFGGIDLEPLLAARGEVAALDAALAELGGDERARAREIDLLRFQVSELDDAAIADADEDARLELEEDALADAVAHQEAAAAAVAALSEEGAAADSLIGAVAAVAGRSPFAGAEARLRALAVELADVASDIRVAGEGIEPDPERLAVVRQRRQLLHELRRKYGDTLAEVLAYAEEAHDRLDALVDHDRRAAELDRGRSQALQVVAEAAADVAAARRRAAPALAGATQRHLALLAMPSARVDVEIGGSEPGDNVTFLLSANPGSPLLPLAKVASGGELARAMLALRLVLVPGGDAGTPSTLVFDEVDAGIGGAAALAVGQALAALTRPDRQVLVVTHLPQVAAFADTQVVVAKSDDGTATTAGTAIVDGDDRLVELSRMLAGTPDSLTTQEAAAELLASAHTLRTRDEMGTDVSPIRREFGEVGR
ncbi:MAG: DNA repair protein RecN [Acidimicrobiales bacterium]